MTPARIDLCSILLGALLVVACDKTPDAAPDAATESASADAATSTDAAVSADASTGADADSVVAAPPALSPSPLGPARTTDELESYVPGTVFGAFQGPAFGKKSAVYGVVRLNCGAGTVLQPIFRRTPESDLEITPPIPFQFYGLETGRPVTYEENGFRVTVDFDRDDPEMLEGEFTINYDEGGEERLYARLAYKGPPFNNAFPPRLEGEGKLPIYPDCFPSGYYRLETKDGEVVTGLIRIIDIDGVGVPFARLLVGDKSALQLMVVPREKGRRIDPPQTVLLAEARRTQGDLGVLIDAHYRPELITPDQAIGANLGTLQESKVLDGKATVRVFNEGRDRFFDARFEDVRISSIIDGPLSGREFKEIRIYGEMVAPNEMPVELTKPPEWYDSEDEANTTDDDGATSP